MLQVSRVIHGQECPVDILWSTSYLDKEAYQVDKDSLFNLCARYVAHAIDWRENGTASMLENVVPVEVLERLKESRDTCIQCDGIPYRPQKGVYVWEYAEDASAPFDFANSLAVWGIAAHPYDTGVEAALRKCLPIRVARVCTYCSDKCYRLHMHAAQALLYRKLASVLWEKLKKHVFPADDEYKYQWVLYDTQVESIM